MVVAFEAGADLALLCAQVDFEDEEFVGVKIENGTQKPNKKAG